MAARVIQLDPAEDPTGRAPALAAGVRALRAGKLVAFPTETVYGVGVVAGDGEAVSALRALKDRPACPFTVHLADPAEAGRYVHDPPLLARALMRKAWPGPLTLLLPTRGRGTHPALRSKAVQRRIVHRGVVGLRCPSDPLARALLRRAGKCVLATSANLAGRSPATSADEVLAQLGDSVDLVLDAGRTRYRRPSTIVAFEGESYRLVRSGVYDAGAIRRLARLTILFVCTGNTCRSPMAAALARQMLAERLGCEVGGLGRRGVTVLSAGSFALGGGPASPDAVAAAARLGAAVGRHRSRKLTNGLIHRADVIFCMAARHVAEIVGRVDAAAGKTLLLDAGGDIADPMGGGGDGYVGAARRIAASLRKRLKESWL